MDECADRYPPLTADAPCLELANTLDPRVDPQADRDHLGRTYPDLLAWSRYADLINDQTVDILARRARREPAAAAATFDEAIELRAAVIAVFDPAPDGPSSAVLATLKAHYLRALASGTLDVTPNGAAWNWPAAATDLSAPLWPLAINAVELLTSPARTRVRTCAGETCGWLFLDRTRNNSRRWCYMRYCGNQAKSTRQAARRRAARAQDRG